MISAEIVVLVSKIVEIVPRNLSGVRLAIYNAATMALDDVYERGRLDGALEASPVLVRDPRPDCAHEPAWHPLTSSVRCHRCKTLFLPMIEEFSGFGVSATSEHAWPASDKADTAPPCAGSSPHVVSPPVACEGEAYEPEDGEVWP